MTTAVLVQTELKSKYEQDPQFRGEIEQLVSYYTERGLFYLPNSKWQDIFLQNFERLFNLQFELGYGFMKEMIEDEEIFPSTLEENVHDSLVYQELIALVQEILEQQTSIKVQAKPVNSFLVDVLTECQRDAYDALTQVMIELFYQGAYYAYKENYRSQVTTSEKNLLHMTHPVFLTPLVCLIPERNELANSQSLVWSFYGWSGSKLKENWIGRIICSTNTTSNDVLENHLPVEIILKDTLNMFDKNKLLDSLTERLKQELRVSLEQEIELLLNILTISNIETLTSRVE